MYITESELENFYNLSQKGISFEKAYTALIKLFQKKTIFNEHIYILMSDSSVLCFSLQKHAELLQEMFNIHAQHIYGHIQAMEIIDIFPIVNVVPSDIMAYLIPSDENESYRNPFTVIDNIYRFENENFNSKISLEFSDLETVVFVVELTTSKIFSQPINIADLYGKSKELSAHRIIKD